MPKIWTKILSGKKESQQLTEEQQADLKFVDDFYDEGMKARRPYEKQWYINMAFFLDQHWLTWNDTKRKLEKPVVPSWRKHITINKIKPNVLHILAKLTKNKPIYQTIPATTEDDDRNRAEISLKVHKYLHRINQMDILNQRLYLWKIIYGTAFKEPYFDESKGTKIPKKIKTETIEGQEVPIKVKGKEQYYDTDYTGEVNNEIYSPFSILPESGATDFEHSQRMMKIVTKSIEYIREKYEAGKFVNAESRTAGSSVQSQLLNLMGEQYTTPHITQKDKKEKTSAEGFAIIKELKELPSKKHPKGRLIRVSNGVLLDSGPLPYKFMIRRRTFGIVKYDYTPVAERFWGDTSVVSMIPINVELNKTVSQIIEIKNLTAKPKWIAYTQNKLIETAITSESGEIITITHVPGVPDPHPIDPPNIPAYVPGLIEMGNKNMEEVALIHEVSKGVTPPGVTSGVAIQFLQEQDQTVFGPVASRFETKEGEAGTYELEIVKERYRESRVIKIVGENNEIEVFDFMATKDMPTDVIVQSGSSLPHSLVAKQQLVLQFYDKGMLGDPQDPQVRQKAMRLAEMGGVDVIYEEAAADEREAEREHKLWEKGLPAEVQFFDNHKTHLIRHYLFCKSDRYRNLIKERPQFEVGVKAHIDAHTQQDPERIAMQKQEQMMQEQQQVQRKQLEVDSAIKLQKADDDRATAASKVLTEVTTRERPPEKSPQGKKK